jgi:DUF438 domain-containing protein
MERDRRTIMSNGLGSSDKKEAMKQIIRELHRGLPVEKAKERFLKEVGNISSADIAGIEQGLIGEGMPVEEIQRFCNVHALLFESSLEQAVKKEESPSHPVHLFKLENREIEKLVKRIEGLFEGIQKAPFHQFKGELARLLESLQGIDIHFKRKENILFPFLERHDFSGPSKVMWGKQDEIRDLLRESIDHLQKLREEDDLSSFRKRYTDPLIEEVKGMIFKEENILFPTSMEKLSTAEWASVFRESAELGYVFIEEPKESTDLTSDLKAVLTEMPSVIEGGPVSLPTGDLSLEELTGILNILPVDITFIDRDDRVRYFSDNRDRIFVRTRSVLGRKVQNCHPPQSVAIVEKILDAFKNGIRSSVDFWIHLEDKLVYIRYFALRGRTGAYLGTLELTQDVTDIRKLEGEKRIYDEAD